MTNRTFGVISFLSIMVLVSLVGCHTQQPKRFSGDEWRSWSVVQRESYVAGFLDGHASGQGNLCIALDQIDIEMFKTHDNLGSLYEVCKQTSSRYSKFDSMMSIDSVTSAYTSVIDDFYKHPECRAMPYSVLLEHLNDKEYKSGEELYKFVRSGPHWGAFSGFDGIEMCLPGYR